MKFVVKHLHFIGIGGTGMCGIAEVLHNLGYEVSGSDLAESATTRYLQSVGIRVFKGHAASQIDGADAVVVSSAVKSDNPEVVAAKQRHIPVVPRAVMLAELMRLRRGIAIAGAHGKTTTTSLTTSILAAGGLDPTYVIGGRLNSSGVNARLGEGEFLVAEADESDASFLNLTPVISAVTNIDQDHMETYGFDFERLKDAFVNFLARLPFYGVAVLCSDDANVASIIPRVSRRIVTYGLNASADVRAIDVASCGTQMKFTILRAGHAPLPVVLNLPGMHNVVNSLAAVAIATIVGVSDAGIVKALAEFRGVGRRFSQYGEIPITDAQGQTHGSYRLVDDYGHHPHEMQATLAAARGAWPDKRIVVCFQPHRYTRTRDCFEDFVKVLSTTDALVLVDVYPAGEKPIAGADGRSLARALRLHGKENIIFCERADEVPEALSKIVRNGDVVITMGAGNIGRVPAMLTQEGH